MAAPDRSAPPTPPPELLAVVARFAAARNHRRWAEAKGAFGEAAAASQAFCEAAAAAGLDASPFQVPVQGGAEQHVVAKAGTWLVDVTARQFRPNDPEWPRLLPEAEAREHYRRTEYQSPWITLPITQKAARVWAQRQRIDLVKAATWLQLAVGLRRERGFPIVAVALIGLPPDPGVPPATGDHRVGEVAVLWRHDDPKGAQGAAAAMVQAVLVGRAMGYERLVTYVPLEMPYLNRADPPQGPPWDLRRVDLPRWRFDDIPDDDARLVHPSAASRARSSLVRRFWANDDHAWDQHRYEEAELELIEEFGRALDDDEADDLAWDLGLREPPIPGDVEAPGDDEIELRYRMDLGLPQGGLRVIPLSHGVARGFVNRFHSHHWGPRGEIFALGVVDAEGDLRCAATFGRPVSPALQNASPHNGEVTRVACARGPGGRPGDPRPPAVDATARPRDPGGHAENSGSKVLGALVRAAAALGYTRLASYTILGESGASYRGAGWVLSSASEGGEWGRAGRPRTRAAQGGRKVRWEAGEDARRLGPEEARELAALVAAHEGDPVPARPARPVPRYAAVRGPRRWAVRDDDTGCLLAAGIDHKVALAHAQRLNALERAAED